MSNRKNNARGLRVRSSATRVYAIWKRVVRDNMRFSGTKRFAVYTQNHIGRVFILRNHNAYYTNNIYYYYYRVQMCNLVSIIFIPLYI